MTPTASNHPGWLATAVADERVHTRYDALVHKTGDGCWYWTGAISGRGHGRFWIARDRVIVAHRFAYAITHGAEAIQQAPVIAHAFNNTLRQRVDDAHAHASTAAANTQEWARRRSAWAGPMADPAGAADRARFIRDGLRAGRDLDELLDQRRSVLEPGQLPLW